MYYIYSIFGAELNRMISYYNIKTKQVTHKNTNNTSNTKNNMISHTYLKSFFYRQEFRLK